MDWLTVALGLVVPVLVTYVLTSDRIGIEFRAVPALFIGAFVGLVLVVARLATLIQGAS